MTFLMYIAGLIGVITIAAGIGMFYIKVPHPVVHIDVNNPNALLKIAGIVLIIGGVLNLVGNVYFGVKNWQEHHVEAAHQTETPAFKQDPLPSPPGG